MKIAEQTLTEQVVVYYRAADDRGDYEYQHTYPVLGTLPTAKTKERTAWDAARAAEIAAQYATWHADMVKPVAAPTKADLQRDLDRARADKALADQRIVALSAAVAVAADAEAKG